MRKSILLGFCALVIGCNEVQRPRSTSVASSGYRAPVISDSASLQRMKVHFPLVEKMYREYAEKNHMPSITYGVVVGDQLVFSGSAGLANLETKTPATTQTVYRIASMSKSFTAMAILKLRDDGKLNLGDPVSKYIPELGGVRSLTTDSPPVSIQHLMTMSAGFPEDNPWGDQQLSDTDQDLLAQIKEGISFSNAPGTAYEYSNLGFALLGRIVTTVSGMPYQKYITDNILKPLGMNDSRYEYTEVPSDRLAAGYRWEEERHKLEPMLGDGAYGAMGGMLCSLEDFARYTSLHLNAWPPRNDDDTGPIKRSSIREMHQPWRFNNIFPNNQGFDGKVCPVASGYGYGLSWRKDCNGIIRVAHSGGLPGFGSEWRIYPDYGFGVISFSNRTYGAPSQLNARVADTLIYLAQLKPRTYPAIPLLEETKKAIMDLLPDWNNAESTVLFAENFYLDQSLALRRAATQKLFMDAGAILRVGPVQAENQLRGQFVVECEKKKINVFFTMTPEARPLVQYLEIWVEGSDRD